MSATVYAGSLMPVNRSYNWADPSSRSSRSLLTCRKISSMIRSETLATYPSVARVLIPQTRYPAAIMRLLYYPARTAEQAEELEPGIGVRLGCPTTVYGSG